MKRIEDMTKDMTHDIQATQQDGQQGEIILYQPDETVRLEVRLEDETVWLTQVQIAELFQKVKSTISFHISNIFKEGELSEEVVVRKYRTTTQHGAIDGKKQIGSRIVGLGNVVCGQEKPANLTIDGYSGTWLRVIKTEALPSITGAKLNNLFETTK